MNALTPNLMVSNIARSLAFYCDILGFSFQMGVVEENAPVHCDRKHEDRFICTMIRNGGACFMLLEREAFTKDLPALTGCSIGMSGTFYIELDDVNTFYQAIHDIVPIVKDLCDMWYGMREFYISDPDGYILCFSQRLAHIE